MLLTERRLFMGLLQRCFQLRTVGQITVLRLMLLQALIAFQLQHFCLFQRLVGAAQLHAQLLDMRIVVGEQGVQRAIVQLRMLSAPFADLHVKFSQFLLQGLLLLLSGLEFGSQLNQLIVDVLQRLRRQTFRLSGLLDGLLQRLLPLLCAGVVAQQTGKCLLTVLPLLAEPGDFLRQFGLTVQTSLLLDLLLLDLLLALGLLLLLFVLLLQLIETLGHLLFELQHGR